VIKRALVVADDLTGAADTAVQFTEKGFTASVIFNSKQIDKSFQENGILVIDTETRNCPAKKAQLKIRRFLKNINEEEVFFLYKKIDSTLRGNWGTELKELSSFWPGKPVFLIPAFPEMNRLTRNGVQYVNDKVLYETEYAEDLLSPVENSYIPDIMVEQGIARDEIVLVNKEQQKNKNLNKLINNKTAAGKKYFLFDAETKQDIRQLTVELESFSEQVIFCGCAGLAGEVDNFLLSEIQENDFANKKESLSHLAEQKAEKTIILSGSIKETTHQQIKFAAQKKEIGVLQLQTSELLSAPKPQKEVREKTFEEIDRLLFSYTSLLIYLEKLKLDKPVEQIKKDSQLLQIYLQQIVAYLGDKDFDFNLVATGGDIALAACSGLETNGLKIIGEIFSGIPLSKIIGGGKEGNLIITKAGGFGEKEVLYQIVKFLQEDQLNNF